MKKYVLLMFAIVLLFSSPLNVHAKGSKELLARRDKFSKHYVIDGNKYKVAVYANPIHYKDDKGKWKDIDNTMT